MEDEKMSVPYLVLEDAQVRSERTIKRLVIVIILVASMLFASNAIWLYAWMQFDYEIQDVDLDSGEGGTNNLIGRDLNGVFDYGENEGDYSSGEAAQDE